TKCKEAGALAESAGLSGGEGMLRGSRDRDQSAEVPQRLLTAASKSIRPLLPLPSCPLYCGFHWLTECEVRVMIRRTDSALRVGTVCRISAASAPAIGAEKEVPDQEAYVPSQKVLAMFTPGAQTSTSLP